MNDALDAIDGPAQRRSSAIRAVWDRQWSSVIAPFLVQRTLLMCVVYFGSELVGVHRTWHALPRVPFLDVWLRWDTMYYLTIAMNGYANLGWGTNSPFFPLFPLLTVVFGAVMPKAIAALFVTNVAALVALGFLYAWIERSFDERTARRAVQIVLVFPTSFFLTAAYSESVYLLAAVGAMLAWSRNKQWLAALGVVLACLARPVGVLALTFPFVIQWLLTSRRVREVPWFVAAASVGAGLVLLIYFASTGDPLAFVHAPQTESLGKYTGEHQAVHGAAILWDEGWSQNLMRRLLNWSALGLIAGAAVHFLRQRRFDLALLTALPALLPLAFQRSLLDAASMGRYALVGFPVFVALARWVPDGPKARALDSGFQMVQVVLAICFATARWAE